MPGEVYIIPQGIIDAVGALAGTETARPTFYEMNGKRIVMEYSSETPTHCQYALKYPRTFTTNVSSVILDNTAELGVVLRWIKGGANRWELEIFGNTTDIVDPYQWHALEQLPASVTQDDPTVVTPLALFGDPAWFGSATFTMNHSGT